MLLAGNVAADTDVTITVQDSSGQQATNADAPVTVTVRAAPLLNSLTITPNQSDCGTTAICSGQNGTAAVTCSARKADRSQVDRSSSTY